MAKFLVRRFVFLLFTMLFVSAIIFAISELAPGDVVRHMLGAFATPEQEESLREQLGLNRPVWTRYVSWLVDQLGKRQYRLDARDALVGLGPETIDPLMEILDDPEAQASARLQIPGVLVGIQSQEAVDVLLERVGRAVRYS